MFSVKKIHAFIIVLGFLIAGSAIVSQSITQLVAINNTVPGGLSSLFTAATINSFANPTEFSATLYNKQQIGTAIPNPPKGVYLSWKDNSNSESSYWIMRTFVGPNATGNDWTRIARIPGDLDGQRSVVEFHDTLVDVPATNLSKTAYYQVRAYKADGTIFANTPVSVVRLSDTTSVSVPQVSITSLRVVQPNRSSDTVQTLYPGAVNNSQVIYPNRTVAGKDFKLGREIGFWIDVAPENFTGSFRTEIIPVGSARGQMQRFIENNARWSVLGNTGLRITPWTAQSGDYVIYITPCSEEFARGICGASTVINFSVNDIGDQVVTPTPTPTPTPVPVPSKTLKISVWSPQANNSWTEHNAYTLHWSVEGNADYDGFDIQLGNKYTPDYLSAGPIFNQVKKGQTSVSFDKKDLSNTLIQQFITEARKTNNSLSDADIRKAFYLRFAAVKNTTGGKNLIVATKDSAYFNIAKGVVVTGAGNPNPTPTNPTTPATCTPKKIVILGSSTAQGTGSSNNQSWVKRFESYVKTKNTEHQVINLAKGGQSSYNVLPTGTPVQYTTINTENNITKALSLNPDGIIVNLPSNDLTGGNPINEVQANFLTIKNAATDAGVKIWFTTTQPVNSSLETRTRLKTMRDWIFTNMGDKALDFWYSVANEDGSIQAQYDSGDGLHLNNDGHAQFYNQVTYKKVLEKVCGQ